MTYEPKEREILDQVVAALHGHYGERLSGDSALVGGASRSVRKTSTLVGGASRSVRRPSALVGGASRSVRKPSALVGGAILRIFIQPPEAKCAKRDTFFLSAECKCTIPRTQDANRFSIN